MKETIIKITEYTFGERQPKPVVRQDLERNSPEHREQFYRTGSSNHGPQTGKVLDGEIVYTGSLAAGFKPNEIVDWRLIYPFYIGDKNKAFYMSKPRVGWRWGERSGRKPKKSDIYYLIETLEPKPKTTCQTITISQALPGAVDG